MATADISDQDCSGNTGESPHTVFLTDLATELIIQITECLQPLDILCLYCAHRWFQDIIHLNRTKISFSPVVPKDEDAEMLLPRLAEDLPQYSFCYYCIDSYFKISRWLSDALDPHRLNRCDYCWDINSNCVSCRYRSDKMSTLKQLIGHADFRNCCQLKPESFYNTPLRTTLLQIQTLEPQCGKPTDSVFCTGIQGHPHRRGLMSAEARSDPCTKDVFLRIQLMELSPTWYAKTALVENWAFRVCSHGNSAWKLSRNMVRLFGAYLMGMPGPYNIRQCQCCSATYGLDMRKCNSVKGLRVVVITKWVGLSKLTPADIKSITRNQPNHAPGPAFCRNPGCSHDPRTSFDKEPGGMTYEDLLRRNMAQLEIEMKDYLDSLGVSNRSKRGDSIHPAD
ncbi:hypothetical protein FE257_006552 [Aspergillus nanangensis]|uniref:F-box domain-containing protein n=1 Tax=Aspergillus nanangensis TaxID=2582783 RepID=A0AAD4CXR2_ASPNN|nr:hypothetical protein FE257_006552 [Aspergillus nanangensis]